DRPARSGRTPGQPRPWRGLRGAARDLPQAVIEGRCGGAARRARRDADRRRPSRRGAGSRRRHHRTCHLAAGFQSETCVLSDGMKRTSFARWPCSIARTMDLLGDWWTPLVLRDAFYGIRRFDEFQEALGIARNTLADRLRRLVDEGLL